MWSRRSLLATGGVLANTALAGCSLLSSDGTPAEFRQTVDLKPADASVVARARDDAIGCPKGDVELRATVFERQEPSELVLLSAIDVYPGRTECKTDWVHNAMELDHDWGTGDFANSGFITGSESNVVFTDTSDPPARIENSSSSTVGRWRVELTPPATEHVEYIFQSPFRGASSVSDGDHLADVRFDSQTSKGWLRDSDVFSVDATLTHGEVADE